MFYGIRADRRNLAIGEELGNSHQWWQDMYNMSDYYQVEDDDYDTQWEFFKGRYNNEMGCWDDGELDGTCCIGLHDAYGDIDIEDVDEIVDIAKALEELKIYMYDGAHIYMICGDDAQSGNDAGELIISNATVAKIF